MSYSRAGSGTQGGGLMGEKREMQDLNDRLAAYMAKVRALKQQKGATIDPTNFLETIQLMENDMARLKKMYEDEIAKLRGQLKELGQDRSALAAKAKQNDGLASDLQARLAAEANKAKSYHDDLNALWKAVAEREAETNALRAALKAKDQELDGIRPELARMAKEMEELRNRLQREATCRQQAEDQLKQLHGKLNFDGQKKDQENKDLKERLNAMNNIIDTLQKKIKQLSVADAGNMDMLLQKIRDGTNAELARYQRQMDEALNKNLGTLKRQLEEDAESKKRLAAENEQMAKCLRDLQAKNAALEAEVNSLLKQKRDLEAALNNDRAKAASRINDLEAKLRELQELIMAKLKDNAAAQGAAASLRAEIDAYRALLEGEANMLGNVNGAGSKPASARSIPQYASAPQASFKGPQSSGGPYTVYQTSYGRTGKDKNRTCYSSGSRGYDKGYSSTTTLPAVNKTTNFQSGNRYSYKY